MPAAKYQRLPASPRDADDADEASTRARPIDPRFDRPPPAAWKRIALILFIIFLFWLSYAIRPSKQSATPEVIYASRYSKEFKYRPAASPVITERLKDGRVRLRGAYPST